MIEKAKAVPLQAWSGPEFSRKFRFPDFMTMAQDGGKVVSLTHRPPLPPGNTPGTHFYSTSRAVPGSIPGGVTGDIFRGSLRQKPCALGSTQPLKMSTRDFSWGKGGRCVQLTTYHHCSPESQEIRGLNLPGTPWATSACRGTPVLFYSFLLEAESTPGP